MNPHEAFQIECSSNAENQSKDSELVDASKKFLKRSCDYKYSYNFSWLGRPIIQYPQDIVAIQEIVYKCQPDLIIETGIAHGGSLILSASMLCLLDIMEGIDPMESNRQVIGIDIDIRKHNLEAINRHPLSKKIKLIEGSSISNEVSEEVHNLASGYKSTMVMLDSNHTEEHVLKELDIYANLTSIGNYCIVFDTDIEFLPQGYFAERDWDVGNNPHTAARKWLERNDNFEIDSRIDKKLMISVAPEGYLRRIK